MVLHDVAASVAASTLLVPHFGDLFAGIDAIGSSPSSIVRTLARVAPPLPQWRVLDIAGGKGAVGVALARRFACRVEVSDACAQFVVAATDLARRRGVSDLVSARVAEASRELARARRDPADVALMLNLWPFDRAAPALRCAVKPGGIYVFDDALAAPGTRAFGPASGPASGPAFGHAPTIADAEALISSLGDRVLTRSLRRRDATRAAHAKLLAQLTINARRLARRYPRLKPHFADFLSTHRAAGRMLEGELRPVLWVVRRRR